MRDVHFFFKSCNELNLSMKIQVANPEGNSQHDLGPQREEEPIEPMIVPLSDASSQPDTVMVELENTVVAHVAVRCARWSEDVAGLAVFEFE